MLKLDIMTESELGQIFGTLDSLIPLHQGEVPLSVCLSLFLLYIHLEHVHKLISDNYVIHGFLEIAHHLFMSFVGKFNLDDLE